MFCLKTDRADHDRKNGGGQRQSTDRGCWTCNSPHLQRNCKQFRQAHADEAYPESEPPQNGHNRSQNSRISSVIYLALLTISTSALLNLGKGFVGNRMVTTMLDSGTNVMAVYRKLVLKSDYTGRYIRCRTFSSRVDVFPQDSLLYRISRFMFDQFEANISTD